MVVKAVLQSKLVLNMSVVCLSDRSFDRHKLNCFPQHNVNVIDAITFILDTYLNKSHKVPAYHRICIEIDPHSHSACARLTKIFPPALQDYIENAIIMYLTTL